jgi:phosphatidylserine/phosphatidylglycerophosphate/cardiolipin synthase-like enzyme
MFSPRFHRLWILRTGLLVPALFALGWGLAHRGRISALPEPAPTAAAADDGPVAAYFSRPQEFDGEYAGGPDEDLARAVDASVRSVDIASYDFDLLSVARALLRAHGRGVAVRIVVDSDNFHTEALDLLRGQGIPVVGDARSALMHDKFVVIDGGEIWAGSMNLTVNDAYRNDNNLLRIRSAELARIFNAEFEEMFDRRRFGPASPSGKRAAAVETEAGPVEVLFAPEDGVARRVTELIAGARTGLRVLAFSFTSAEIAGAMLERWRSGVSLSGVMEKTQVHSNTGNQYDVLQSAGADVRLDANPRNMHHKVILIDGEILITGSYNFTASAEEKNDEDLLIFRDRSLAEAFEREFRRIRDLAGAYSRVSPSGPPPEPAGRGFPAFPLLQTKGRGI